MAQKGFPRANGTRRRKKTSEAHATVPLNSTVVPMHIHNFARTFQERIFGEKPDASCGRGAKGKLVERKLWHRII